MPPQVAVSFSDWPRSERCEGGVICYPDHSIGQKRQCWLTRLRLERDAAALAACERHTPRIQVRSGFWVGVRGRLRVGPGPHPPSIPEHTVFREEDGGVHDELFYTMIFLFSWTPVLINRHTYRWYYTAVYSYYYYSKYRPAAGICSVDLPRHTCSSRAL